jgi:methylmalonyl-CoA mutase
MEHLSLLAGGRQHTVQDWERQAAAVLRKAGRLTADDPDSAVWDRLTRTTLDDVAVTPLGTRAQVAGLPSTGLPGQAPYTRGSQHTRGDGWDIRTYHADPDPGVTADATVNDLETGATSLWLSLGPGGIAVADLPRVLDRVYADLAPVAVDAPWAPVEAAEALAAVLDRKGVRPAPGTTLGSDPVSAGLRGARPPEPADVDAVVARLAELAQELGAFAFTVDATAVHDAGGTDAQELGYSLAAGAAYLRRLTAAGLDVAGAARLLEFRYAATDEQLPTIAKLRAARRAWHRVLELSGAAEAGGQAQHAVTSRPMMTRYDPWVNMLRTTVAAFAAGVGGATSVTVLPFDTAIGLPDAFSRRIARNTSSLLVAECHVARVTDPAGGAFAVETLTEDLARAAWDELGRIEAEGGVEASLALSEGGGGEGLLGRVRDRAAARTEQVARRRRRLTGVSEFPDLRERLPERRPHPDLAPAARVESYAAPFERLRDHPPGRPVFLATMGPVAAHTARASFAANLLAAGGVETVTAGPTKDVAGVLAGYDGEAVACLCGTDRAYAEWGADLAAALRQAGATYVVVAGKPGDLPVDDSAALGDDALAFLGRARAQLGAHQEEAAQ